MSVATEIQRLQTAKAGIKSALEEKGVVVDSATTLDGYPLLVESIPSGGDEDLVKGLIDGSLTALTVPNDVTSLKNNLFQSSSNIKVVNLHSGVTSLGASCFNNATQLTAITAASGVTNIGANCFQSCNNLVTIDGLGALGNIGQNFMKECYKLEAPITISGTSVAEYAFQKCYKVPSYTFTGPTVSFGSSNYYTGDTYSIFQNNTGCTYWDFTNCYFVPITNTKRHFNGCTGEFRIPAVMANTFLSSKTPYNENNFFHETSMSGNVVTAENKYDVYEVYYTTTGGTIMYPSKVTSAGCGLVDNMYDATTGGTFVLYGPSRDFKTTFSSKNTLQTITFPSGFTTIASEGFRSCTSLSSITIPDLLTVGSSAFSDCKVLQEFTNNNVTAISDNGFAYCSALSSVSCENLTTLGAFAFRDCKNLKSVSLQNLLNLTPSAGSRPFYGCSSLETINLQSAQIIGAASLQELAGLKTLNIPSATELGANFLQSDSSLESITLGATPPSVNTTYTFIGVPSTGTFYVPAESVEAYTTWKNTMNAVKNWTVQAISE